MKIKRYTAPSMRSALDQVRIEQGPEAVILSSRRIPDGIEVIAAVDYDETLMQDARVHYPPAPSPAITPLAPKAPSAVALPPAAAAPRAPVPKAAAPAMLPPKAVAPKAMAPRAVPPQAVPPQAVPPQAVAPRAVPSHAVPPKTIAPMAHARTSAPPAPMSIAPKPAPSAPPARVVAPVGHAQPVARAVSAPDPAVSGMRYELNELRQLLERELASLAWTDKRERDPLKVRVLEDLSALDIAPDMARKLAALTPRNTRLQNPGAIPVALLAKHLPMVADPASIESGVIAVVGPTGVGKTTTIAKLAARWCVRHGPEDLALVSTDSYRIGAREQLLSFARILGVPLYAANDGKELAKVLGHLKSKKLTLIDTAGVGPRDVRLTEQLTVLRKGAPGARVLLALPAQGEGNALEEVTMAFSPLDPAACILTKVDEAASFGAAMSIALRHSLPIAYLCNGQRVPEDLHPASLRRVWLIRAAMSLQERAPPRRDEAYLARHFGRGQAHA